MNPRLLRAVEEALGAKVRRQSRAAGGDISIAHVADLDDGRSVFIKTNDSAHPSIFLREAEGLAWLREASAVRIPAVLAASESPPFLVLEAISSASKAPTFDEQLGRGLAALHRYGASSFGFSSANFIGSLDQDNRPMQTWADFYRERRLGPQVRLAVDQARAPVSWIREFDALFQKLDALYDEREPPCRLHGDLWNGNVLCDERVAPCLIDPAVYGGHREIDLAMLQLFGGPSENCFRAYDEMFPLSAGFRERIALHQLYPLLVHVNLFGGSYVAAVERGLRAYL